MRLLWPLFGVVLLVLRASASPQVVTTHTVLTDLIRVIAADRVEVRCLLPINLDPHSYEPKPADIRLLARADLVVMNGLGLEPWAEKVIANSGFHGPVIKAAESVSRLLPAAGTTTPAEHSSEDRHDHHSSGTEQYDPHAWHNPRNVVQYVTVIRDALIKTAPAEAEYFQQNAARYLGELETLDQYARAHFDQLSPDQRKLVTSHDSLRYLADAYGLTIISVAGTRPDQEPSARQLAELIKLIRSQRVRAVFFEATASPKLAETLASDAGIKVIGQLYTDSLGPAGSSGATYLGMFRSNVDTLVDALK